jgi:hypothetical protein
MKDGALKLALEALETPHPGIRTSFTDSIKYREQCKEAITAIKQALAAPVQEPVAYLCENAVGHKYFRWKKPSGTYKPIALYTTPPAAQRQWVGLTDEEMYLNCPNWLSQEQCKVWIQQIEAKLKEKNT